MVSKTPEGQICSICPSAGYEANGVFGSQRVHPATTGRSTAVRHAWNAVAPSHVRPLRPTPIALHRQPTATPDGATPYGREPVRQPASDVDATDPSRRRKNRRARAAALPQPMIDTRKLADRCNTQHAPRPSRRMPPPPPTATHSRLQHEHHCDTTITLSLTP